MPKVNNSSPVLTVHVWGYLVAGVLMGFGSLLFSCEKSQSGGENPHCDDGGLNPSPDADSDSERIYDDVSFECDADTHVEQSDVGHLQDVDQPPSPLDVGECVCHLLSPCCDGCLSIRVGEACDTHSLCVVDEICMPDGTCMGGSACLARDNSQPECSQWSCNEEQGCFLVPIREGEGCNLQNDVPEHSFLDGVCADGVCIGEPCLCDAVDACCDGCMPVLGANGRPCPTNFTALLPGSYQRGSPADELGRYSDESPHLVTLTRTVLMQRVEVTQSQWQDLMGNNPARFSECGPNCPVESISWHQALAYCNALSIQDDLPLCYEDLWGMAYSMASATARQPVIWADGLDCLGYRLPTEAEWEYGARAGSSGAFFTGEPDLMGCFDEARLDPIGWYCANSSEQTHPVSLKTANPWGLYDMHGNVAEWVWDAYEQDYEVTEEEDPFVLGDFESARVHRGGAWRDTVRDCRAAKRGRSVVPGNPDSMGHVGLRPVRTWSQATK